MKNFAGPRILKPLDRIERSNGSRVDRLQEMAGAVSQDMVDDYLKALSSGKRALKAIAEALSDAEALERRIRLERLRPPSSATRARALVQVLSTARERVAASLRQGDKDVDMIRQHYDSTSSEVFR